MARLRVVGGVLALLAVVFALNPARAANPPEVDHGLSWLNQQVQPSGALTSEGQSVATPLQSRAETLATLAQLATPPSSVADAIAAEPADATEYLARRIASLAPLGRDVSASLAALQAMQNADGAPLNYRG